MIWGICTVGVCGCVTPVVALAERGNAAKVIPGRLEATEVVTALAPEALLALSGETLTILSGAGVLEPVTRLEGNCSG